MLTVDKLRNIVCGEDFVVNDKIRVHNPTIGEIGSYGEERYIQDVNVLTMRAYDAAVFLWDLGKDFREVEDYMVFIMLAKNMLQDDLLILPGIQFSSLAVGINPATEELYLYNDDVIIDKLLYRKIVGAVRDINFIAEKPEVNPGSKYAVKMWVKREREKMERAAKRRKPFESPYADMISALVNSKGFDYNYQSVQSVHISQLMDSFYRIAKIQNYENTMHGIYSGCVDAKKIGKNVFDWFGPIDVNKREIDESKIIEV